MGWGARTFPIRYQDIHFLRSKSHLCLSSFRWGCGSEAFISLHREELGGEVMVVNSVSQLLSSPCWKRDNEECGVSCQLLEGQNCFLHQGGPGSPS